MELKLGLLLVISITACFAVPLPNSSHDASRIVGGSVAANGSAPYMAALIFGGTSREMFCGGSILSQRSILTAAHCIDGTNIGDPLSRSVGIVVGTNQWRPQYEGQYYELVQSFTHPNYDPLNLKHDIAIVITRTNIIFSPRVQPVRPSWDFVGADVVTRAAGWGYISYTGRESEVLLELTLKTIEGERCAQKMFEAALNHNMNMPTVEPEFEICVNHAPSEGHGMCAGDSGSALVREDNGMQVGIVSWGIPCGRDAPDVFVRVSAYEDWIMRVIV